MDRFHAPWTRSAGQKEIAVARLAKLAGVTAVGLLGVFVGFIAAILLRNFPFDSGLATLIGAALGASITVAGSLWITSYQIGARERSVTRMAAQAAGEIRDQAYVLTSLLELEDTGDLADYAEEAIRQVNILTEVVDLLQKGVTHFEITDYDTRRSMAQFEATVKMNVHVLEKELKWLERPTAPVVENARSALMETAEQIYMSCCSVCRELGLDRELPSDDEVSRRIGMRNLKE